MSRRNSLANKAIRRAEKAATAEGYEERKERSQRTFFSPAKTVEDEEGNESTIPEQSFTLPSRKDRRGRRGAEFR